MTSNLGILPPDLENVSYKCRIWYDDGRKMKELLPKILQVVSKYYPDMVVKECSALDFYLKTQQGVDIEINLKGSKLDDLLKVLESQD